jgi:uncharacterized protein
LVILAFLFLACSFLSLWVKKDARIWGSLLVLSLVSGAIAGLFDWIGFGFILALFLLWIFYERKENALFFVAIVLLSVSFKLRFLPGFHPFFVTDRFAHQFNLGLEGPLIGLFPLAFVVPLAKNLQDWKIAFKGLAYGCAGIALLAVLAWSSGAVRLDFKLPAFMAIRTFSNLVLTSIPEEGFFRGFVQNTLSAYFKKGKWGNLLALVLSSALFTLVHIFWSPNLAILAFTFIAGLLYGIVYLFSGKIESAILCHFLLNLIHMTFFSYHSV